MDVRTAGLVGGDARESAVGGGALVAAETVNGDDGDARDPDEDADGSNSEISTIAKEVDKVNQIINNCIDALKLDVSSNAASAADGVPQPPSYAASQARNLLPLSNANNDTIKAPSPKVHHSTAKMKTPPRDAPPQTHPPAHPHPSMAPVPLVVPLSERPGISGGGFLTPPYRDPPPANAARSLPRRPGAAPAKAPRGYGADVPEQRGDPPKYQEKTSPAACKKGERGINGGGVSVNGAGLHTKNVGCSNGGGGGGPKVVHPPQHHPKPQHLDVQPDYHSSEHRHSFPALYYEDEDDSPRSGQRPASFLKGRSRRDAPAGGYAQLSPSRHRRYNSGYSSSPEYSSSESALRIWERFRPYRKSPREEAAACVAAGHALRKKVQFAKDEDLHDILDYWKGVSAQQKL